MIDLIDRSEICTSFNPLPKFSDTIKTPIMTALATYMG